MPKELAIEEVARFTIPYRENHPDFESEQFNPEGEISSNEFDNAARQETINSLMSTNLPYHLLTDVNVFTTHRHAFEPLADALDQKMKKFASDFVAAMISHIPFNILRGLLQVVFDSDVESFLGKVARSDQSLKVGKWKILASHLIVHTDAINQSLLRTAHAVVRSLPSPHSKPNEVLPAIPVFDSVTGRAHSSFIRRELTDQERLHPNMRLPPKDPTNPEFGDVPIGQVSIISNIHRFRRSFNIFTMGLMKEVDLGMDKAVVTGGAVTACLLPWPKHIEDLYQKELAIKHVTIWALRHHFNLPLDITKIILTKIESSNPFIKEVDQELFSLFHGPTASFMSSDIDIFMVSGNGSLESSANHLTKVYQKALYNRQHLTFQEYIDESKFKNSHWTRHEKEAWWEDTANDELMDIDEEDSDQADELENSLAKFLKISLGDRRLTLLPTIRTTNSITLSGVHPVRHVQMLLPVVKCPEEFMLTFDLDCVSVCYDGNTVWAAPRSIRSFNTRTNFVTLSDLRDQARVSRMCKYSLRGFSTVLFEVCKHFPRCDVNVKDDDIHAFEFNLRESNKRKHSEDDGEDDIMNQPFEDCDEPSEWILRHVCAQPPDKELPIEKLNKDYTPIPLIYGPNQSTTQLISQVNMLRAPYFGNIRPLISQLPHSITSDPIKFSKRILAVEPRVAELPGMWWKWEKDSSIQGKVMWGNLFVRCYMCGDQQEIPQTSTDDSSDVTTNNNDNHSASVTTPSGNLRICDRCATINLQKRNQTSNMKGKLALITGGRTKIGYHCAVRLLRCGATVYITTRFPLLAAERFQEEKDHDEWWSRLHIVALDFRDVSSVLKLTSKLKESLPQLDVLINNAAQTIQRPPQYYQGMVQKEAKLHKEGSPQLKSVWLPNFEENSRITAEDQKQLDLVVGQLKINNDWLTSVKANLQLAPNDTVPRATLLTQLNSGGNSNNSVADHRLFPSGSSDIHGEPLDLRSKTSWTTPLPEVPIPEIVEVMIINTLVPALLIQQLGPLLCKAEFGSDPRFVVNVTSPEGNFTAMTRGDFANVNNNGAHPHTNMAKASLNRLTQTIGSEMAKKGVYVTSVDPGWVSFMQPLTKESYTHLNKGNDEKMDLDDIPRLKSTLSPPLTEQDGAARVLDPVFNGLNNRVYWHSVLLRDFKIVSW